MITIIFFMWTLINTSSIFKSFIKFSFKSVNVKELKNRLWFSHEACMHVILCCHKSRLIFNFIHLKPFEGKCSVCSWARTEKNCKIETDWRTIFFENLVEHTVSDPILNLSRQVALAKSGDFARINFFKSN